MPLAATAVPHRTKCLHLADTAPGRLATSQWCCPSHLTVPERNFQPWYRYYTFQFHLEEIVDATEQLQATLCDLIGAMPRNTDQHGCPPAPRI